MLKNNYLNNEYNKIVTKYPQEKTFHATIMEMLLTVDNIINSRLL